MTLIDLSQLKREIECTVSPLFVNDLLDIVEDIIKTSYLQGCIDTENQFTNRVFNSSKLKEKEQLVKELEFIY